jgi:hypothetical protein
MEMANLRLDLQLDLRAGLELEVSWRSSRAFG